MRTVATTSIDSSDKHIDSRDVAARIEHLADLEEAAKEDGGEPMDEDEAAELVKLRKLADEGISEWEDGAHLIREDEWVDYVREMLADIGTIPKDLPSWVVLDWDATAANVAQDYSTCAFDGATYYYRNC